VTPKEDIAASVVNDMSDLLDELNRLDGRFAVEAAGHPYGDLKTAMVSTIAAALDVDTVDGREVYELMRDNDMTLERAHRYWLQLHRGAGQDELGDRQCGACGLFYEDGEHHCDLAPAGETAVVSRVLIPALAQVGELMSTAFKLTTGRTPRWIEADETSIHCDFGVMSTETFRDHFTPTSKETA
jgi:hypothetical protein